MTTKLLFVVVVKAIQGSVRAGHPLLLPTNGVALLTSGLVTIGRDYASPEFRLQTLPLQTDRALLFAIHYSLSRPSRFEQPLIR